MSESNFMPAVTLADLKIDVLVDQAIKARYGGDLPEGIILFAPCESFQVIHVTGENIHFIYDLASMQIVGLYLENEAAHDLFEGKGFKPKG